ncbi:synaptogenesis protein syg-2-like, partial [Limulus polyphemus]|uniref:Synaptogenesis protein syg-2-like n=1 Tax=Limulus polyphemus TaxID=6850 RepID=A0ABM1SUH4_LIMPO
MRVFGAFLCYCFGVVFQHVFSGVPGIKLKPVQFYDDQTEYFEYNSVVGDKVVLPCNITPPSFDDSVALILWYIGDSGNPIYSVDARNEPVQEGKHFSSDILGSRAKFNISLRSAFLVIEPVKADDSGEYRCRVDFRRGRTQNRKLKVNVIVPPKEIYVQTGDKKFQDTVFGPINEGSSINLTCIAVGGNPSPSVKWWREEALMDDSYTILKDRAVFNSLEIRAVDRTLSKATITCQAMNTNLTMPKSVTIKLDVNYQPKLSLVLGASVQDEQIREGHDVYFECNINANPQIREVEWLLDDERLFSDPSRGIVIIGKSLRLQNVGKQHRGTYQCQADNVVGRGQSEKVPLNVQ